MSFSLSYVYDYQGYKIRQVVTFMSLLFCLYAVSELFLAIVSGSEPVVLRCHLPRDTSR